MTVKELVELEVEQLDLLRERSRGGDNQAAQVLLEHLRAVSKAIEAWKEKQDAQKGKKGKA